MDVKQMNKTREDFMADIADSTTVSNFQYVGKTSEGLLFQNENEDSVIVRVIVKKEDFDAEDAMSEYAEKDAKAKERLAKSAEKREKAEKAKAEKEAIAKSAKEKEKKAE